MDKPYLVFSTDPVSKSSVLFKRAAELKNEKRSTMTVCEQREAQAKLAALLILPPGLETLPADCAGVGCEWVLRPESFSEKIVVYLHGGGWSLGNLDSARPTAAALAQLTPYKVLSVGYRLAPEHPYPAALDDCRAAYGWLLGQGYRPENIALFGDSAGGNLCLCLLHRLLTEGLPVPCAFAGVSPVTDISLTSEIVRCMPPLTVCADEDGGRRDIFSMYAVDHDRTDPLLSPLYGDLGRFPPMLLHAGGEEPLALDCAAFVKKAAHQGADARLKIWREMFHDFSLAGVGFREGRESMRELGDFLMERLGRSGSARRDKKMP